MEQDYLESKRQSLEDAFFMEQDKKLIAKLHELQQMKEDKDSLSKVSGITNDKVLERLVALNVRPETVAMLAVVPLVEIAWADGSIDEKESRAIMSAAEKIWGKENQIDAVLLNEWLLQKPPREMLEGWTHYVCGLCEKLTKEETGNLKAEIIGHARQIADASGGFLGLGSRISKLESEMIRKLESAFVC